MSERPLLLLPAKKRWALGAQEPWWAGLVRWFAIAVGILMVAIGLADVSSRIARSVAGEHALFDAFAPAAALKPQSALPVPAAAASTTGAFIPARVKVPSLGIDAQVEEVGRKGDGSMGTPADFLDIGWWSEGARPGDTKGSAVFDGHVNNALTKAGVFEHLSQVRKGDYITVADASGRTLVYHVSEVSLYDTDQAPRASIFAKTGAPQIVLITCDGEWVQDEHSFDKRLVVVAKPAY